jgi:hypothetical protein
MKIPMMPKGVEHANTFSGGTSRGYNGNAQEQPFR